MRRRDVLRAVIFGIAATGLSGEVAAQVPPGHPPMGGELVDAGPLKVDPDTGEPLDDPPPGHPGAAGSAPQDHGAGGRTGTPGVFEAPPDTADDDDRLPAGTIAITILDPDNKPIPRAGVVLATLHNTVAKGESTTRVNREADADGTLRFDRLESGVGIAYSVTVPKDGANFASAPFQLPQGKGKRVALHVYPVTHDINVALVVLQCIVYMEMKDDRVQIQEAIGVFNFGRIAWVPENLVVQLPENYTAFNAGEASGQTGVEAVSTESTKGARLRGTFGPGRHDVDFRWQLPYAGESSVEFEVGMPPRLAVSRVLAAASHQMSLEVAGFDAAQGKSDPQGQYLLITEKQIKREDPPLKSVRVALRNLPTMGPGRYVASGIAALGVFAGIGLAFSLRRPERKREGGGKPQRTQLLAELEDLEKAHLAGEIGPNTYERARRELIDAIARTLPPKR